MPGNIEAVDAFCDQATRHWYKALRCRSQRTSLNWTRMHRLAQRWLPPPRIIHPWPDERFDARTQGRSPVRYQRRDPAKTTKRLVAQLERLGHVVTLQETSAA